MFCFCSLGLDKSIPRWPVLGLGEECHEELEAGRIGLLSRLQGESSGPKLDFRLPAPTE